MSSIPAVRVGDEYIERGRHGTYLRSRLNGRAYLGGKVALPDGRVIAIKSINNAGSTPEYLRCTINVRVAGKLRALTGVVRNVDGLLLFEPGGVHAEIFDEH